MAVVTQYSPRFREEALRELPDKLIEIELNDEETKQAVEALLDIQRMLSIKKDSSNEYEMKFSAKIAIKYFKKRICQ